MIHPFLPLPIYGAIWYQGEANAGQSNLYGCAVREMVADWRMKWSERTGGQTNPDFPFGQCQVRATNELSHDSV
jgi:sialate O-acetylesterase